ncbi:MAG: hypothetical protein KIIPBIDF_01178 [Candidatus Methanoperedenaceae archaeon GB50]|nr:phasin family protein [Candidatus Desulfofervidus auxilii]CAD7772749.1 MAG: hypothetical protein KCCBMMGE_00070 [Candidatus Methanoperedenaceae archaeon GB37]CAD7779479.1 MAG: hypothetical protein KIIPBIDF_01178 [Candidatus Methanoperedenaceae archaeon GB50]
MLEWIKKGFYTSLGLGLITKEKAEELAKEMIRKGQLSEKEGHSFVEELLKKSEEAQQELENKVEALVAQAFKKLDIPTREEFQTISQQLSNLEKGLKELQEKIAK